MRDKVYCEDCRYWDTVPAEIGFGCQCRLCDHEESPVSKSAIKRNFDPLEDNKNYNCIGYKPNLCKRIINVLSRAK